MGSRRVQLGQSAALYCRVSTADQTCARQERDQRAFAKKAGYKVVGVWRETASGAKQERAERKKVLALAQARKVDVILVTELTRWVSRCTQIPESCSFVINLFPGINCQFTALKCRNVALKHRTNFR
jgi:DNA invertase Pin-like site-specific DNA recombinase